MRIIRFLTANGETRIGEERAGGSATLLLDALGLLEPKHDRRGTREMLRDRCALVADDDRGIRETVGAVLKKLGCDCISCEDGAEAISTLEAREVDLVVSDIVMPEQDGYAVFAAAKRKHEDLPVILITGFGYDPSHQIVRATERGLEGVLFKPFTPQELVDRIDEAIRPTLSCGNGYFLRLREREVVHDRLAPVEPRDLLGWSFVSGAGTDANGRADAGELFVRASATVVAPGSDIRLPRISGLSARATGCIAVVIGKRLSGATAAESEAGVLGYTLATDVVCASADGGPHAWGGGRAFDASCPLGPAIVTPDEVGKQPVELTTRISGSSRMRTTVTDLSAMAGRAISRISSHFTLEPGSVVLLRPDPADGEASLPPLRRKDVVRVEASGLGELENTVA